MASSPLVHGALFEVHLAVQDRSVSTVFYERVLGFTVARTSTERDFTFLWMGKEGSQMLGLWGPNSMDAPVARGRGHFAWRSTPSEVEAAVAELRQRSVKPLDFHGRPTSEPDVIGWMPAVTIYFCDPDGHSLEILAMLPDDPRPDLGILPLSAWRQRA